MKRIRIFPFAAAGVAAALGLAACGGSSSNKQAPQQKSAGYNAAINGVVNPSSHKGETLTLDLSSVPDSTDMGNTYYAFMWNTVRLYSRALVTYKSVPGAAGNTIMPDLATSLGQVGSDGLTWTYHLKPNIKFEDGTTVTSKDVKYAVERTYAKDVLPNGPSYFKLLLKDSNYPGPYKDKTPGKMGLTSITTPDASTIVFHLAKPFSEFDYVAALPQTAPVPPAKDKGANYQLHPVSTGPYMFQSYQPDKQFVLVKNPNWDPATDPNRKQLVNKFVFNLNANADDALSGFLWFTYINTKVKPLDNVHCRRAVEYAADKTAYQTAYGGPVAGGDIASTVLVPTIVGYEKFDMYAATTKPHGDLAKARQELTECGQADGFST